MEGTRISLNINVIGLLEKLNEMVSDSLIEIFTTKMGITSSGEHFEDTVVDGQDGNIKGTTTEIEHNNVLFILLVETVGNSGSRWLIDDTKNFKSSNNTGIFGGLSLRIIEIGGDGNDGVLDILSEVVLGDLLHLSKDHSRNFFGGELLVSSSCINRNVRLAGLSNNAVWKPLKITLDLLVVKLTSDETLNNIDSSGGVSTSLVLSGLTDKTLFISESNKGWGDSVTKFVGNDLDTTILKDTDTRVGSTQIDTNNWSVDLAFLISHGDV